jgi:hypothetical protein
MNLDARFPKHRLATRDLCVSRHKLAGAARLTQGSQLLTGAPQSILRNPRSRDTVSRCSRKRIKDSPPQLWCETICEPSLEC